MKVILKTKSRQRFLSISNTLYVTHNNLSTNMRCLRITEFLVTCQILDLSNRTLRFLNYSVIQNVSIVINNIFKFSIISINYFQ